jgi:hypothetical protein
MIRESLLAAILVIGAAAGGGPASQAQQLISTQIVGGSGGANFSDPEPATGARVLEVQVRSGEYVDSVQMVYALRDNRTVAGPRRGGSGGTLSVFHLDADEYIIGISGRAGTYIDSISFQTNKRTSPLFGGNGGDREYRIDIPAGNQAVGFTGRMGRYLDAVGLNYAPRRRGIFSSILGSPQREDETGIAGGTGGTPFGDRDIPAGARIVEVRVQAGEWVDAVQAVFMLSDGRTVQGTRHGGSGGNVGVFRLDRDEYVIGLSGRCGERIDSLRIQTNKRTSQVFGGRGGSQDYRIDVPAGNQAVGFTGRSGQYLDAIGLIFAPARAPSRRFPNRRPPGPR